MPMDHPKTFKCPTCGKTYPWIPEHPDNYTWEDGTQACTPIESQIEWRKFIEEELMKQQRRIIRWH